MSYRPKLMRIAKWSIAVLVTVGLVWAAQSAIDQWQDQTAKIEATIEQLDRSIEAETDANKRLILFDRRTALQSSVPSLGNLRWQRIGVAATLYAIGIFVPGLVLHQALASLGKRPRRSTAIAAQLLGQAGKYVPGKAMVIVLRAHALARDGVRPIIATIAVFMETLLMMGVGATVACVVICWLDVPEWMTWAAVLIAIMACVPTAPPILKHVAARIAKVDEDQVSQTNETPISSMRFFWVGWSLSLVSWLFIGASFSMLVMSIPSAAAIDQTQVIEPVGLISLCAISTAAIGLAMVVGFASLLPGGAGVRELVLTTILASAVGMANALLAAIAARLMFIAVESACAGVAWYWLRRDDKRKLRNCE